VKESNRPADSTRAVHAGRSGERPHHTLAPSIAQTATYTFESTAALERYMRGEDPDPEREEYGRYGNPTVRELEERCAALEGADDGVAFASGMAAITTAVLSLVKTGEHIVRVVIPIFSQHQRNPPAEGAQDGRLYCFGQASP